MRVIYDGKVAYLFAGYPSSSFLFVLLMLAVQVACNLWCDSVAVVLLIRDWLSSASNDLVLRRNISKLRRGEFTVAPFRAQGESTEVACNTADDINPQTLRRRT